MNTLILQTKKCSTPQPLHKPFAPNQVIFKLPDGMTYKAMIKLLEEKQITYKWQFSTLTIAVPRTGFIALFK